MARSTALKFSSTNVSDERCNNAHADETTTNQEKGSHAPRRLNRAQWLPIRRPALANKARNLNLPLETEKHVMGSMTGVL